MNKVRVQHWVSKAQKEILKRVAKEQKVSESEIVRQIIYKVLKVK